MNEVILELILMAVMAFFMIFGLIGCQHEKKMGKSPTEDEES